MNYICEFCDKDLPNPAWKLCDRKECRYLRGVKKRKKIKKINDKITKKNT